MGKDTHGLTGIARPETITAAKALIALKKNQPVEILSLRYAAIDFFAKLFRNISAQEIANRSPMLEQDVTLLIHLKERIERDFLTLPPQYRLCEEIGMSESKAKQNFKQLFSISIARYIHQCKMAHAHALLAEHKMNVNQCAFAMGYSNVGHFITAFKKYYGVTPKDVSKAGCLDLS